MSGFPKNPPTSAPMNGTPEIPMERHIGTENSMCFHSALLSPVQIAPARCVPTNIARERTNGRSITFPWTSRFRMRWPSMGSAFWKEMVKFGGIMPEIENSGKTGKSKK